jgi:ribonuclease HI
VKQINGEYRVKEKTLKKFYQASVDIVEDFDYFEIRHIPRAENSRADWLANHAMDLQESHGFDEIPDF